MRREIIVDDLTGHESDKTESVPITWQGKKVTLDLSPDSVQALDALFTGQGSSFLRNYLAPDTAPAAGPKRTKSGSHESANAEENKLIRAWWATPEGRAATDTGADDAIPNRGRIPAEVTTAYQKAFLARS